MSQRVYRLATENGLFWRSWNGEIVVLNEASGDTHRLDLIAAATFEALLESPADLPGLARRVAADLGASDEARIAVALETVLATFLQLSLVE